MREWYPVKGSSTLYCFRAGPGVNDPLVNELQCSFVPCFCAQCRAGNKIECEYLEFTVPWFEEMREKEQQSPHFFEEPHFLVYVVEQGRGCGA